MSVIIMDGIATATSIKKKLKNAVSKFQDGKKPILTIMSFNKDEASKIYIRGKVKDCVEVGIIPKVYSTNIDILNECEKYGADVHSFVDRTIGPSSDRFKNHILNVIGELSDTSNTDGFIIQEPIEWLEHDEVINYIDPLTDVDCFTKERTKQLYFDKSPAILPCTPMGIMTLLNTYNIDLTGKHVVIVGRSKLVGKPLSTILLHENCTTTVCNSFTKNLGEITKTADILISSTGKAGLITSDMVKSNSVVIDVGITRDSSTNKIVGDVSPDVMNIASYMTPVPGGVGPMTRVSLLENVVILAMNNRQCDHT